jgi:hypothetical protein
MHQAAEMLFPQVIPRIELFESTEAGFFLRTAAKSYDVIIQEQVFILSLIFLKLSSEKSSSQIPCTNWVKYLSSDVLNICNVWNFSAQFIVTYDAVDCSEIWKIFIFSGVKITSFCYQP